MGIHVRCPHGHEFKVKDKYAGKKGLCPYCKDQVKVLVPDNAEDEIKKAAFKVAAEQHGAGAAAAAAASVFDDHDASIDDPSASCSLMNSSVVRHNVRCKCGESVPMWFAKCPNCGHFFEHR